EEKARDRAVRIGDRLIDKIHIALLGRALRLGLQQRRQPATDVRLATLVDLIEQVEKTLSLKLRQRLAQGFAYNVPAADQLEVGGVGKLENKLRAAQHAHEARRFMK